MPVTTAETKKAFWDKSERFWTEITCAGTIDYDKISISQR